MRSWLWDNFTKDELPIRYLYCRYCESEIALRPDEPRTKVCPECRAQIKMGLDPLK